MIMCLPMGIGAKDVKRNRLSGNTGFSDRSGNRTGIEGYRGVEEFVRTGTAHSVGSGPAAGAGHAGRCDRIGAGLWRRLCAGDAAPQPCRAVFPAQRPCSGRRFLRLFRQCLWSRRHSCAAYPSCPAREEAALACRLAYGGGGFHSCDCPARRIGMRDRQQVDAVGLVPVSAGRVREQRLRPLPFAPA